MKRNMTKRLAVYLPDSIHKDLEEWAAKENRPTSNLAAFILEFVVRDYAEREIGTPSAQKDQKQQSDSEGV